MSDQLSRGAEDGERQKDLVKSFNNAQEAIDAVQKDHAVGMYKDTSVDEWNPDYLVFYDSKHLNSFEKTLTDLKKQPGGTPERMLLSEELNKLAGSDVEPSHIHWIYRSEWSISPNDLLRDEDSKQEQQDDDNFFSNQREHFSPENTDKRRLEWEEERAVQTQIWIESGGDDEEYPYDDDDRRDDDFSDRDDDDDVNKLPEEPFDEELSIRDPNPPIELGTSREKIEKGTDN